MAKYCIDSNVIVAAVKILDYGLKDGTMSKSDIKIGDDGNTLYDIIRSMIKGMKGELVTTMSIYQESERNMGDKSKHRSNLNYLSKYYNIITDLLTNKMRLFKLSDKEYSDIKKMREKLSSFKIPDDLKKPTDKSDYKNIYTDYILARECSENGITKVVTRNEVDFEMCSRFDKNLKIPTVVKPTGGFWKKAHESYIPRFTNSIAGRLLESIYKDNIEF